jgi:hypothetical protein
LSEIGVTPILRRLWTHWLEIARAIAEFQSRLLLTLFYFTVFVPFGLIARLVVDPLRLRRSVGASAWVARAKQDDPATSRRQF